MNKTKFKPTENKKFSEPLKKTEIGMIPEDWEAIEINKNLESIGFKVE